MKLLTGELASWVPPWSFGSAKVETISKSMPTPAAFCQSPLQWTETAPWGCQGRHYPRTYLLSFSREITWAPVQYDLPQWCCTQLSASLILCYTLLQCKPVPWERVFSSMVLSREKWTNRLEDPYKILARSLQILLMSSVTSEPSELVKTLLTFPSRIRERRTALLTP